MRKEKLIAIANNNNNNSRQKKKVVQPKLFHQFDFPKEEKSESYTPASNLKSANRKTRNWKSNFIRKQRKNKDH